jgi:hypothetical protein
MSDFSDASDVVLVVIVFDDDWLGLTVKALIELVVLATSTPHNTADPNLIFII